MATSDRKVLELRHLDRLRFDEIGRHLDITADSARKRYAGAVVRLQRLCADSGLSRPF